MYSIYLYNGNTTETMKDVKALITDLRKLLQKDDLYSTKDELLLVMLGNAYDLYKDAIASCKLNGVASQYTSLSGVIVDKPTSSYTIMLEQSKEIFKYLTALYLTPASRKMLLLAKQGKGTNPFDELTKAMAKAAADDDDEDEPVEKETPNDNNSNKRKTSKGI